MRHCECQGRPGAVDARWSWEFGGGAGYGGLFRRLVASAAKDQSFSVSYIRPGMSEADVVYRCGQPIARNMSGPTTVMSFNVVEQAYTLEVTFLGGRVHSVRGTVLFIDSQMALWSGSKMRKIKSLLGARSANRRASAL